MDPVILTIEGTIATVTLNRPAALNALSWEMNEALVEISARLEHDTSVRCVVIRGAGEHFMAGGDVKGFTEGPSDPQQRRMLFERGIAQTHSIITRLRRMPKPVIASVSGAVAGFGISLMSACDLVVAADSSFFYVGVLPYRDLAGWWGNLCPATHGWGQAGDGNCASGRSF